MSGELAEKLLNAAEKRSKYAEVRFMEYEGSGAAYRNGSFEGAAYSRSFGYSVRVLNNSLAMSFSNSENFTDLSHAIDIAVRRSMSPGKSRIVTKSDGKKEWVVSGSKKVDNVSLDDKISMLKDNDSLMDSLGSRVRMNYLSDRKIKQVFMNSEGSEIRGEFSRVSYIYFAGIIESGEFEQSMGQFGSTGGYEYFDSIDLEDHISNDIKAIKNAMHAKHVAPGKMDLVIGPEISGIVAHESAGHPTEYDRIVGREGALAGESFLTGKKLPMKIGSESVSVIDDPSMKGSYGFYVYDDEGIMSRKRYLYRKGYTDEFIHNRESAARQGVEPNGGGRSSSWNMEPLPRMSTTYIEPGEFTFEELLEGVKDGIYVKNFTEWNIDDIRFNEKYVGKEAYRIRNGIIAEQVRRPVIETNTIKFYSAIDAVAREMEFFAGECGKGDPEQAADVWMGGPHARLRGMYIQ
jgi:TldD protein